MRESVLTKGTENALTFCLHGVMQSLKVKEKMGHIFTAQGSFVGHENVRKNRIPSADFSKPRENSSGFIGKCQEKKGLGLRR